MHLICDTITQLQQACCDHTDTSAKAKDSCLNTEIGRKFLILSNGMHHCLRSYTFVRCSIIFCYYWVVVFLCVWCSQQSIFWKVPQSNYNDRKTKQGTSVLETFLLRIYAGVVTSLSSGSAGPWWLVQSPCGVISDFYKLQVFTLCICLNCNCKQPMVTGV